LSIPVPLGVRIYDHASNLDMWVTRWVDELQFRSVIPGGFASASFRLHLPQSMYPVSAAWATRAERIPLVRLFNRVQVVDQRSSEIAWEGRIESAARVTDDGFAWDVGCAGGMVAATDITRPVFYIDSELTDWFYEPWLNEFVNKFNYSQEDDQPSLKVTLDPANSPWQAGTSTRAYMHQLCRGTNQYLGRFSCTYMSTQPQSTNGNQMRARADVYTPSTDTLQEGVDSTTLGAATARKVNKVGTDFTSTQAQAIYFDIYDNDTVNNVSLPTSGPGSATFVNPVVVAMRMDRNGTNLTAAASYSADWVTVSQVVEDVVGRYLNGGWTFGVLDNPTPGSVGSANIYIDKTDTSQITNLKFKDGATAADILNQLMTVQTDAYWAIWESQNTATNDPAAQKFRFEWATWPAAPGYMVTSADGLDEQPDASNVYNFVFYQFQDRTAENLHIFPTQVQEYWDSDDASTAPLLQNRVTRAATVKRDGITPAATAFTNAAAWIAANGKEVNTGSVTVRRPIQFYDAGVDSWSGAGRMVDPWMVRPGKLIRIIDVPPQADIANFNHGTNAPPSTHAGAVFKVVATNYDTTDNSCRLELDQVTTWSLPGQIVPTAASNIRVIPG
jgi:hypothetical protein